MDSGDITFYFRHNDETPLLYRKYYFTEINRCFDHDNNEITEGNSSLITPPFVIHPEFEDFSKNRFLGMEPIDFIGINPIGGKLTCLWSLTGSNPSKSLLNIVNSEGVLPDYKIGFLKDSNDDLFIYSLDTCWSFGQLSYNMRNNNFKSYFSKISELGKENIRTFFSTKVGLPSGDPFTPKLISINTLVPAFPLISPCLWVISCQKCGKMYQKPTTLTLCQQCGTLLQRDS
ncbi:MAG: hypothetical protein ACXADY_17655 [Candidatus Hodarchaeales archaeon]